MAILNIIKDGDPTLRKTSREVKEITPRILTLLDDMTETLHEANGCGLAAVQVGVLRRVVLVETDETGLLEFINPVIVEREGEQEELEGCLSIPREMGIHAPPDEGHGARSRQKRKRIHRDRRGTLRTRILP